MALLRWNRRRQILRKEDCEAIARLMDNGFTLQECMNILEEKENTDVFRTITERLNQGEQLSSFFHLYCPPEYRGYFEGFIRYMPFQESLEAAIHIVKAEEKQRTEIIHGMAYPVLLFAGMMAGIWLFCRFVLPSMISMMSGFHMDGTSYMVLQKTILFVSQLFLFLMIFVVLIVIFALQKKNLVKTYQILAGKFPDSVFVQYASADFARFYLECEKRNVSTSEAMKILKTIDEKPLVAYIAGRMDEHLLKGETLEEAVRNAGVEAALLRFLRIAVYSSECEKMLEGYLDMVHMRTERSIRRFSRIIQLFSYSSIGFVLVFVYRILMMPMNMLQNL